MVSESDRVMVEIASFELCGSGAVLLKRCDRGVVVWIVRAYKLDEVGAPRIQSEREFATDQSALLEYQQEQWVIVLTHRTRRLGCT